MNIIKFIAGTCIALIPAIVSAQTAPYLIDGQVNPKHNGKFIKLIYQIGKDKKVTDSVKVENGAFKFTENFDAPLLAKLSFGTEESGDRVDVFLDQTTTRIAAKDSLRYAQITGSKLTASHEKFAKMGYRKLEFDVVEIINQYRLMPESQAKKDHVKTLLAAFDNYNKEKRRLVNQFINENPDSYVALYHLVKLSPDNLLNYETVFPYYSKISASVRETALGKEFGKKVQASKSVLTGEMYKDFVSTTPDGKSLALNEILKNNKYTLLDFWASWCGPCRAENPHVVKTYQAFKDKGFSILSVSLDDKAEKWNEAIKADGMPWHHVSSLKGWKEPAAALYYVKAIPMNALIDSNGKIVATNLRGDTLYEKINSLLK